MYNSVPVTGAPDGVSVVGSIVVGANVGTIVVGASVGVAAAHTIRIGFAAAPALAGPCGEVSRVPPPAIWYPLGTLEYSLVPARTRSRPDPKESVACIALKSSESAPECPVEYP